MRMLLALLFVVGNVAHADDLKVGAVRGGSVHRIDASSEAFDGFEAWGIQVRTTSKEPRELVIPITVPHDLAITRLTMRLSTDEDNPLVSEVIASGEALESYRQIVESWSDPALLEWVSTTERGHQLRLHVFPVSREVPAKIILVAKRGEAHVVTREHSLIARFEARKPILAKATNVRRLGDNFHAREPLTPESRWTTTGATRPQRALDRGFVEVVPDQHELRAPRVVAPRVAVTERRVDPRAFDEASTVVLTREMHETFRTD